MDQPWFRGPTGALTDRVIAGLLFVVTFTLFWFSPIHQVTDSTYSMLLSQSLLKYHSFALDHYAISAAEVQEHTQLERVNGHIYYYPPAGGPMLSMPFVAVMNAFHLSAANPDGTFKRRGEVEMQAIIAALLMAALTSIFFFTGRLVLTRGWGVLIALGAAFGTQVWSTASRALWSHTWEIALLGLAIWLLLAAETGKYKLRPVALATLLAWSYFARPTGAIPILTITLYMLLNHRRMFLSYALAGACWAISFAVYSWVHFRHFLPRYYLEQVSLSHPWLSLAGSLVSPSRGLLIYVPIVMFVLYLLVRYWNEIAFKRLAWLAVLTGLSHLITLSALMTWWGGACYGARLTTDLVPWFVLLSILAINGMLRQRAKPGAQQSNLSWRATLAAGCVLLLLSIFINARGALSRESANWEAWRWQTPPAERDTSSLWEWKYPQFLAGLIQPPLPAEFPPAKLHLDISSPESLKYLWYGWSGPEPPSRWTDGHEAAIIFSLSETNGTDLRIRLAPLVAGELTEQNVNLYLNEQPLTALRLTGAETREISVSLPRDLLRTRNVLRFSLPNAFTPKALNIAEDERLLGVRVEWLEFRPMNSPVEPSSLPTKSP